MASLRLRENLQRNLRQNGLRLESLLTQANAHGFIRDLQTGHTDVHVARSTIELLTEEEQALKEQYTEAGFYNWSRRDFQH